MPQQRKFFPGWLVVASGFVIMATCYTIFVNCMSLFQPLIVSNLGITLAQYNISNAISTVVSVVGSLVIGHALILIFIATASGLSATRCAES